jgi:hypothetical protein
MNFPEILLKKLAHLRKWLMSFFKPKTLPAFIGHKVKQTFELNKRLIDLFLERSPELLEILNLLLNYQLVMRGEDVFLPTC